MIMLGFTFIATATLAATSIIAGAAAVDQLRDRKPAAAMTTLTIGAAQAVAAIGGLWLISRMVA